MLSNLPSVRIGIYQGESSVTNVLTIAPVGLNLTAKSVRLHEMLFDERFWYHRRKRPNPTTLMQLVTVLHLGVLDHEVLEEYRTVFNTYFRK